ncbi:MAG: threonylcarbamoyl-AMP synthase [Candidatus Marinimicrobia bacterium]|nr:threonylcarbamoyl-AMP synthase [Candidatus Neomarinimicrobiota bacterium]|tara:strand:+ start:8999 stop:9589 length:591 start_codon:yes stop_codon:yes gene_type:complete
MEIHPEEVKIISALSSEALAEAADVLNNGGIVAYPTDTLYGLGADALNTSAVQKVSQIKGRSGPWSIAVSDHKMLEQYCVIPKNHATFVTQNLPGSVTLILPEAAETLAPDLLGDDRSIGMRIPDHSISTNLVRQLGRPITSTSVNRSGESAMNDPIQIAEQFPEEIQLIIDAGTLHPSSGSTIYNLTRDPIEKLR